MRGGWLFESVLLKRYDREEGFWRPDKP